VGCDAVREDVVCGGGEEESPALRMLVVEELKQRAVVREGGDIQRDGTGKVLLERGLALGYPAGDGEDGAWMLAGEDEGGIEQGV